jgi:hypothetical protein
MKNHSRARRHAGALLLTSAIAGTTALAVGASGASAATLSSCDASALQLSVLGSAAVTANHAGGAPCVADTGTTDLSALGLVSASLISSNTAVTAGTRADAHARVTGLHIGASSLTGGLSSQLLGSGSNSIIPSVSAAINAQLGTGGSITNALAPLHALGLDVTGVDATNLGVQLSPTLPAALNAALPDVINAGVIDATANAVCADGSASLGGTTELTNVNVLGSVIDANDPAQKVLSLDTAHITLSQLVSLNAILKSIKVQAQPASLLGAVLGTGPTTLYDVLVTPGGLLGTINALLPVGTTLSSILGTLNSTLQPTIDNTQINLPAGILHAVVTPRSEVNDGGTVTETALSLSVTALSQPVLSGDLARASVTGGAAGCTTTPIPNPPVPDPPVPTPTPDPVPPVKIFGTPSIPTLPGDNATQTDAKVAADLADAALQCTEARLRLTDVRSSGGKTLVQGIADRSFAGKTATIYLTYGNKKVGTTTVDANGVFAARVALPAAKIRSTNAARYYAIVGGSRTGALKFVRRMMATKLASTGGKVTFAGYTTTPRAKHQAKVVIQQRVSCSKYVNVAAVRPNAKGRFSVTFKAPVGATQAVYRAQTFVPKSKKSKKPFGTYTLPTVLKINR